MSVPRHLDLDPLVRAERVGAASGELAALVATPPAGVARRPGSPRRPRLHRQQGGLPASPAAAGARRTSDDSDRPTGSVRVGRARGRVGVLDRCSRQGCRIACSAIGEPRHIVAHSFGGLVCREAVLSGAPALSLTLLGSGPGALGGTRGALIDLMRPLLVEGGVPAVWAASEAIEAADPKATERPPAVREFLRRRFLASPTAALLGMGAELISAPDRVAELRDNGIPTFVRVRVRRTTRGHQPNSATWPIGSAPATRSSTAPGTHPPSTSPRPPPPPSNPSGPPSNVTLPRP